MTAAVQADASPEQFEALRRETERRCPVTQMFIRSGLDFSSGWTQMPLTADA